MLPQIRNGHHSEEWHEERYEFHARLTAVQIVAFFPCALATVVSPVPLLTMVGVSAGICLIELVRVALDV